MLSLTVLALSFSVCICQLYKIGAALFLLFLIFLFFLEIDRVSMIRKPILR